MSIQEKTEPLRASTARTRPLRGVATALLSHIQPRERFFLLLLPRILLGRCTASRAAGYAFALSQSGNDRLAAWCWMRAIRAAQDEEACHRILNLCMASGNQHTAVELANWYYDANGMLPASAVRLMGTLVLQGHYEAALKIYDRLSERCECNLFDLSPAPRWSDQPLKNRLRSMLAEERERAGSVGESRKNRFELQRSIARLCFSFGVFDISARLFERVHSTGVEDRVAHAYALLRNHELDELSRHVESDDLQEIRHHDADWLSLAATVFFATGRVESAQAAVEAAVRTRFSEHVEVELIVADCQEIVSLMANCPQILTLDPTMEWDQAVDDRAGLRKIFVCGNGWSGSGALYEALTDYEGFSEAPDTPLDRYVNPCTGNEMMIIQGAYGLGTLWRKGSEARALTRIDLWDLFRCHFLGGGAIGFTEHKGAKTASDLLAQFDRRYAQIFRVLLQPLARNQTIAPLEQLRGCLVDATEAFARLFTGDEGDVPVVFNNAIFGSNIDMLNIITNFKAAVVARDPRDQFSDRRNQDLKHWMTARRFASVYRASRERFKTAQLELRPGLSKQVCEVQFESLVRKKEYRQKLIDWLQDGRNTLKSRSRFDARRSELNIGIYRKYLSDGEHQVLVSELKRWCLR